MKKTAKSEAKNGMRKTYLGTDSLNNKLTLTIDSAAGTVLLYGTATRMLRGLTSIDPVTGNGAGYSQACRLIKAKLLACKNLDQVRAAFRFQTWVEA